MSELIVITPETIPTVRERIEALLRGRAYRTFDGKSMARQVRLATVSVTRGCLRIDDSEGLLSVDPGNGPASIQFDGLGFTLRYTSPGQHSCMCIYTIEVAP